MLYCESAGQRMSDYDHLLVFAMGMARENARLIDCRKRLVAEDRSDSVRRFHSRLAD